MIFYFKLKMIFLFIIGRASLSVQKTSCSCRSGQRWGSPVSQTPPWPWWPRSLQPPRLARIHFLCQSQNSFSHPPPLCYFKMLLTSLLSGCIYRQVWKSTRNRRSPLYVKMLITAPVDLYSKQLVAGDQSTFYCLHTLRSELYLAF